MKGKNAIIFLGGLIVGCVAGVFGSREYFRKTFSDMADEEIEEMEKYFEDQLSEIINTVGSDEEVIIKQNISETFGDVEVNPDLEDEGDKTGENDLNDVKEKLQRNYEQTTNYAKMYSKKNSEHENEDEDQPADEMDSEEALGEEYMKEHEKNKGRAPKIISEESLGELAGNIDQKVLLFYRLNDVITDEEDQIIDDPDYLIGDALDKYNFRESDEQIIFVQNFDLDTVYEVHKVEDSFEG